MKKVYFYFSILIIAAIHFSTIPVSAAEKKCPDTSSTCFEISSPEYPDAYIITETSFPANDINKNAGSLGSVSVTVFVEETYDIVNDELVITESKLLTKEEVLSIGIDNFDSLNRIRSSMRSASSSRGRLTITFSGSYNTTNGVSCNLTGSAHWDCSGFYVEGENFCATGEDFIGVTWAGAFSSNGYSISGMNHLGGNLTIYSAEATPNAGRVWSFDDVTRTSGYNLYAEDISLNMNLRKNSLTGNGNTAEAVLKYIHTYSTVNGSVSISPGSGTGAGSFTLSNTEKQWSIFCTVTNIPY